ncbi:MAG: hypothetical protein KDA57_16570 [Planctomycetales bacterium]|nr:hypothetical protein [Planctomycetales bacterium]
MEHANAASQRYEISITSTAKSYRPDAEYRIFDEQRLIADSIADVRDQLRDIYGTCKRVPMYVDRPNDDPKQVGWVYCFNSDATVRGELQKWRQQDWVQVRRLLGEIVDPRELKR